MTPVRLFLAFALAGLATASLSGAETPRPSRGQSTGAKPNIVFIFSDDHSLQTIGAYGARLSAFCREQAVTPNIDRLAERGGLFVNSFCGNSLCSPSRAAIQTGLHSHANGVMTLNKPIKEGLWTFPRALREAGYQSAVFGKWHLDTTKPEFDEWMILPGQGTYNDPLFHRAGGDRKIPGYTTDVITDLSLEWLKRRDRSKPFFLAVQHKAPHRNFIPPPRYATWLDDITVPEPDTLFDDYANRASPARNQKMSIAKDMVLETDLKVGGRLGREPAYAVRNADFERRHPTGQDLVRWKYQQYLKDYLRCVRAVDDSVGRVVAALEAEGLAENTIVIYSSDQGFYMGEHGWFDKRWIYEESVHMPFIVRWPGVVKPGTRFTPFIQNIDYAATFVELAGGKVPSGLHGRSFVPVLRGQTPADWRQNIYYHYYDGGHGVAKHYGVRTSRYTLAHFYETNEWELFDNEKDPRQLRSVYADPGYAKIVGELKAELSRLRQVYQDSDAIKPGGGKAGKTAGKAKKKQAASGN
ncbi:MAG: sulfatase [Opitutaceae bacterium]|nr:sulfatase [Opitutaceae bacterium]